MYYEELFNYEPIKEDEIDTISREELCEQVLDLQERLIEIHDFIHSLIDEIDEKEALLNEIHQLTDI